MGSAAFSQDGYNPSYKYQRGTGYPFNSYVNFTGLIDEPTLYTRALTATEVQNIFAGGSSGKCYPAITLTPTTLPNGTVNVTCFPIVTASGGTAPYTFAVSAGALPTNMVLESASGKPPEI